MTDRCALRDMLHHGHHRLHLGMRHAVQHTFVTGGCLSSACIDHSRKHTVCFWCPS